MSENGDIVSANEEKTFERKIATLKFHSYFSNRMVLQSNVKNKIWGYTDPEAAEEDFSSTFDCR